MGLRANDVEKDAVDDESIDRASIDFESTSDLRGIHESSQPQDELRRMQLMRSTLGRAAWDKPELTELVVNSSLRAVSERVAARISDSEAVVALVRSKNRTLQHKRFLTFTLFSPSRFFLTLLLSSCYSRVQIFLTLL